MDNEIEKYFPMPSYRPKQREVLLKCHELFENGKKLILLQAPVGFGKSAVNTALCRYYVPSIYTTPQLSLIDQIKNDPYMGKYFVEIKGRDNYRCSKLYYMVPIKFGLCKREKNIIPEKCNWIKECPYYSQKIKAIQSPLVLMSTAYFIVDAYVEPPNFMGRNLLVIDEGHFLSEFVANQVSLENSSKTIPKKVWEKVKNSPRDVEKIIEETEEFLETIQTTLDGGKTLTEEQVKEKTKAEEWLEKAKRFIDTEIIAEWVWIEKNGGVIAMPVYSRYFMEQMIWSRAEKFLISSATILKPELWIKENGADISIEPKETAFIDVGMTFPPENRKVIDMTVGSMKKENQKDTIQSAVDILLYIINSYNGSVNIAIHFPSYNLANTFYSLMPEEIRQKTYLPKPENRDAILEQWKKSGGLFFAVAYHEGQDWKYDTCRVQILVKTLYPDVSDPRIKKRIERKDFDWLMWVALVKCLQAYGRAIRAEDDYMEFYVLDSQFWELVRMKWKYIPEWFREVIPKNRWPKSAQKHNQHTTHEPQNTSHP